MVYAAALGESKKSVLIDGVVPPRLILVLPLPGPLNMAVAPLPGTPASQLPGVAQLLSGAARPVHVLWLKAGPAKSTDNSAAAGKRRGRSDIIARVCSQGASSLISC
jgi:hypothetical protein